MLWRFRQVGVAQFEPHALQRQAERVGRDLCDGCVDARP